jgi:diphosphomevalonate decarboxylase
MHAIMITSSPSLFYWKPTTLLVMNIVRDWRNQGMPVFYTIDAGPNLHILCPKEYQPVIAQRLAEIPGVIDVIPSSVGGPTRLVN